MAPTSTDVIVTGLSGADLDTRQTISDCLSSLQVDTTYLNELSAIDLGLNDMPWIASIFSVPIDSIEYKMNEGWESFRGDMRSAITSLVKRYLQQCPGRRIEKCGRLVVSLGDRHPEVKIKVNVIGLETIGVYFDLPNKVPRSGDISMHTISLYTTHEAILKQNKRKPMYSIKDNLNIALNETFHHVVETVGGQGREEVWAMYYKPVDCQWPQIIGCMTRDSIAKSTS